MKKQNLFYKFEIYVPESHCEALKIALSAAGAGQIGNYSECFWQTTGAGQFRCGGESRPFIGKAGELCHTAEVKLEFVVSPEYVDAVVAAIRAHHPYETPAFAFWRARSE